MSTGQLFIIWWFLFGIAGAALLSRFSKAGIGCLLGVLGPIGCFIAFRMRRAALAVELTPESSLCGTRLLLFQPFSRIGYLVAGVVSLFLSFLALTFAANHNHTLIVPLAGLSALGLALFGLDELSHAAFPDPVAGAFENGILLGRIFIYWKDLQSVDYSTSLVGSEAGKRVQHTWVFHRPDGTRELLNETSGYIKVDDFNQLLKGKGVSVRRILG